MEQYKNEKYNSNYISEGVEIVDRHKTCYEMRENFLEIGGAQ